MIEKVEEFLDVIALVLPLIIGLIVLIAKLTKSKKLKKVFEDLIDIEKEICELMQYAESFNNYNGNDKKELVKTKVNQFCIENNIKYDDEIVNKIIEQFIILSKTVNKREKETNQLL